jgi:hypothetical protein
MRFPKSDWTPLWQTLQTYARQGRSLLLMLLVSLCLTGCMDAKTSIHFDSPQHGSLTQHIKLGSQLATAQGWLNQLERQARKLNSNVDRPSRQELNFTLSFNGARDLATKFNQLFNIQAGSDLPAITSNLTVATSNLLLFDRHRVIYDLDLSALGVQGDQGEMLLNAGSGLDWSFGVSGPWGAGSKRSNAPSHRSAGEMVWTLQPGQKNHLEAVMWMPNPLGWGAALIVGIVTAGIYYDRQKQ